MKILQVNCVYSQGSTGKITHDIHKELLAQGFESVVYYGRGQKTNDPGVTKICSEFYGKANNILSRIRGTMYGGCHLSTNKLIRAIQKEKPDVVHLQCINGYFVNIYRLLSWLKQQNIPTVLTLHAEFMYTGNCGHALECEKWKSGCGNCPRWRQETKSWFFDRTAESWRGMHSIYQDWENLMVVCCSDWIKNRASQSGEMMTKNLRTIHNGIDNESIFYPREGAAKHIRQRYGIDTSKKIILYVAPFFSEIKGFDKLLTLIESTKDKPYQYVLVGDNIEVPCENATVVGKVFDQIHLAELYSAADVFVMCSKCDNYPTVCLEATSCGTPIVGFDVGGVKETIPLGMGGAVPLGDIASMMQLLLEVIQNEPSSKAVANAREYHNYHRMVDQYIQLYGELLEQQSQ